MVPPPLAGICSLTLAHPPAACGGAGQISNKKAPSSKLVVLFCCLFAVRGGFENENQCATESIE